MQIDRVSSPTKELILNKSSGRHRDGSTYNFAEIKTKNRENLSFRSPESEDMKHKAILADVAKMYRKRAAFNNSSEPRLLILWRGYDRDEMLSRPLPTPDGEEICFSLNAAIDYYLGRILKTDNFVLEDEGISVADVSTPEDEIAAKFMRRLKKNRRLQVFMFRGREKIKDERAARQNFCPETDFVGVGPVGYPSNYGEKYDLSAVFNASFFLLEGEDHNNPYSLLGEHYNLWLHEGRIKSPPLYNRTAFLRSRESNWQLKRLSLQDIGAEFAGMSFAFDRFSLNSISDYALYNRCFGLERFGHTIPSTPRQPGCCHYIIVDDRILGCAEGGGATIPQNGFVISLPKDEISPGESMGERLDYHFLSGEKYTEGIQNGPALIDEGEKLVGDDILSREEFFPAHISCREEDCGVVPTDFAYDVDSTRAARMMLGITAENELGIIAVEGRSLAVDPAEAGDGMSGQSGVSAGATLAELAELARKRDYHYALNLDGGGSANLLFAGKPMIERAALMGEEKGDYGCERMVPVVGVME